MVSRKVRWNCRWGPNDGRSAKFPDLDSLGVLASLGVAVCIIAVFGVKRGPRSALRRPQGWPLPSFGSPTRALPVDVAVRPRFSPPRARARELGFAFSAALLVHLALVACLCAMDRRSGWEPSSFFGVAAGFTYLLALLSIQRVRQALPQKLWPPIRFVAMNYIAFAFLLDFAKLPSHDLFTEVRYLPFAALAIIGPILKLSAWAAQAARARSIFLNSCTPTRSRLGRRRPFAAGRRTTASSTLLIGNPSSAARPVADRLTVRKFNLLTLGADGRSSCFPRQA